MSDFVVVEPATFLCQDGNMKTGNNEGKAALLVFEQDALTAIKFRDS